jgi:DNA invertase Pin-like site-specific DNA recombinase
MIPTTIQRAQRERLACVYVRQSTPVQVRQHHESAERQYALRERAVALGWPPSAVEVIDEDQGRSGASAAHRPGFQRLVSRVGLGEVGLVLMLEASRLARSNSEWHRLIELCGLAGALIADEGAVYDPRDPNDRLLLGVKGTLSEAELFTLRLRLHEGRWNKARKGLLAFPLPVGYVRGDDGGWELDPDAQVRERLAYLFATFQRVGVARAVVRELNTLGLTLPTRVTAREGYGALSWKTPTLSAVVRVLTNPAYAGAYVYGRWGYAGGQRSAATGKLAARRVPLADWPVVIRDHHPAYLSWEAFVQQRERLRANWYRDGQPGAAREGRALLQGIVGCGVCGQTLHVQHGAARDRRAPVYVCDRAYRDGAERICQTVSAWPVDAAVVEAFLEAVSPLRLELSRRVLERAEQEGAARRRQQALQLEQAQYEARLAQRRYEAVDPDRRLVAAELERCWEEALARVAQLEQTFAQADRETSVALTNEERATLETLAQDLPAIWHAETTTDRERKQLLRFAITRVDLDGRTHHGQVGIQIHWRSGTITTVQVDRPRPGDGSLTTPAEALALIRELAPYVSYVEIARRLNEQGRRTAFGHAFTSVHVGYLCRRHGWERGTKHARSQLRTAARRASLPTTEPQS